MISPEDHHDAPVVMPVAAGISGSPSRVPRPHDALEHVVVEHGTNSTNESSVLPSKKEYCLATSRSGTTAQDSKRDALFDAQMIPTAQEISTV